MTKLTTGSLAPDFTLPDQDGAPHTLHSYRGSWVLLYFYPKDDTPGCTLQACGLRDAFPNFDSIECVVLGISPDSPGRHKKFKDKYALPFTLLSDEAHEVATIYGAWGAKTFMGKTYEGVHRSSFLIDSTGVIRKVYAKVTPATHADEVLTDLRELAV